MPTVTATCGYCGVRFTYRKPPRTGGFPRRYCTATHRRLANRARCRICKAAHPPARRKPCPTCGGAKPARWFLVECPACTHRRDAPRCIYPNCRNLARRDFNGMPGKFCNDTHKGNYARRMAAEARRAVVQAALHTQLDARCRQCGDALAPQTEDGVLVDWCVACQIAWPVPVRGVRTYDQRARLEAELAGAVESQSSPVRPGVGRAPRPGNSIAVGRHDPNDWRRVA